jgi:hypothetical protein
MLSAARRLSILAVLCVALLGQLSSCCCLGGAVIPPITPTPPSEDLAQAMRDRLSLTKAQQGPFTVEITDQELTSYIVGLLQSGAGEFPARDMQILFQDGYLEVWATFIEIAPTDLPAYVRATVTARDGQPVFYIEQASAGQFPVPGAMRQAISDSLTETFAELGYGLEVEDVQILPGRIVLSGQISGFIPDLP